MANFKFSNINIKGIYTSVSNNSKTVMEIGEEAGLTSDEILKFQFATGVKKIHSDQNLTTSDYCVKAAEELLNDLCWKSEDIDAIIFLTQTPDYILPKTTTIIQSKLKLREDIFVLDINDGCSGFMYGLITAFKFCSTDLNKVLLMMGETPSKIVNKKDKSANLLFGDGGACIAIEYNSNNKNELISNGIDGSGFESIIIKDGGFRNVVTADSLNDINLSDGITRNQLNLQMNGEDVFLFGISKVPKEINKFLLHHSIAQNDYDYFVMHQANLKMNSMISKKLKISDDKVLYSIEEYGNTSSLSIPLTITNNRNLFSNKNIKILCCGFGVGLSWGTGLINLSNNTKYKNILYA
jgi:3-oxoacyl-[acyl-carrier-protein] synthase-3